MKKSCYLLILFLFIVIKNSFGFQQDSISSKNLVLYEKVYLHVDRDFYSPGDSVWFKSYLVNGQNNELILGYKNIYVQLISDSGNVVINKLLLSQDGIAFGDFQLPDSISDGTYTIRAYTKYLENFGEECFFYKKIAVSKLKNSLLLEEKTVETKAAKIDVSFLPESGCLIENSINSVAFKAIDETGKGVAVRGKIIDESGKDIVSFNTSYMGMGKFVLTPQEGKTYYATVEEYPEFSFQFEPAKADGIGLSYIPGKNYIAFALTRNIEIRESQEFVLRVSHKGVELFNTNVSFNNYQQIVRLYKWLFPTGISKITLVNSKNIIVAERLIFVKNKSAIQLSLNNKEYKTRENVELNVISLLSEDDTILSTLSVSVVHEDYISSNGVNQTIESYLLLDSELKGSIESPSSFFIDDATISSNEKLDLLMLVNGWRNYYWDTLKSYKKYELTNWIDAGLSIKGKVKKLWGKKPVVGGEVTLGLMGDGFFHKETFTNEYGFFNFEHIYIVDSSRIMIKANTKRGSQLTKIDLFPQLIFDTLPKTSFVSNITVPVKFYRANYFKKLMEQEYTVKQGEILLGEVEVTAKKRVDDNNIRIYGEADNVLVLSDLDRNSYDIYSYLHGKVAGIVCSTNDNVKSISIRGSGVIYYLNGIQVEKKTIDFIPMNEIDKIEIIKSAGKLSLFGMGDNIPSNPSNPPGFGGVVAIYTRQGNSGNNQSIKPIVHGRISPQFSGFHKSSEFYSPKYTYININDPKPDYRPTLFWEPNLVVENGKAKINFYTSDNLARYRIIVEGISKNGNICFGSGLLNVSNQRD